MTIDNATGVSYLGEEQLIFARQREELFCLGSRHSLRQSFLEVYVIR